MGNIAVAIRDNPLLARSGVGELPLEVLDIIFASAPLTLQDVGRLSQLNHWWSEVINDNTTLWTRLHRTYFPHAPIPLLSVSTFHDAAPLSPRTPRPFGGTLFASFETLHSVHGLLAVPSSLADPSAVLPTIVEEDADDLAEMPSPRPAQGAPDRLAMRAALRAHACNYGMNADADLSLSPKERRRQLKLSKMSRTVRNPGNTHPSSPPSPFVAALCIVPACFALYLASILTSLPGAGCNSLYFVQNCCCTFYRAVGCCDCRDGTVECEPSFAAGPCTSKKLGLFVLVPFASMFLFLGWLLLLVVLVPAVLLAHVGIFFVFVPLEVYKAGGLAAGLQRVTNTLLCSADFSLATGVRVFQCQCVPPAHYFRTWHWLERGLAPRQS
eukprot:gnl/Hemi2/26825_TR9025_c0_g1_i1.p1 gnl/Hemi2/26825_TR9025_c0_g1~~gnl/Hemi2/26825_TR9025_c0_g1_i1.p1  ORF type:complete len:384 (-),score=62.23 gnl/Hemi2/26825_TR9025_c0_g1_i1:126-1277(-)